jgi:endonuclease YncB( thermonuclease family)
VVEVYHGDTFKIDLTSWHPLFGDDISIRLFGVDTPEMRGTTDEVKALAMQAQQVTEKALIGASKKIYGILNEGSIFALLARYGSMENCLPKC